MDDLAPHIEPVGSDCRARAATPFSASIPLTVKPRTSLLPKPLRPDPSLATFVDWKRYSFPTGCQTIKHSNALRQNASEHAVEYLHDSVTFSGARCGLEDLIAATVLRRTFAPMPSSWDDANRDFTERSPGVNRLAMSIPRIPQAIVFDMDGLLFDTEAIYREAMIATALRLGFEMPDQLFLAMVGLPAEASRALLRDHYGNDFDVDTFWVQSANDFHKLVVGRRFLKAGVVELLGHLDRSGLTRAIATSSRHQDVQRNLAAHGLEQRFHAVVAHGDYVLGKPNPDPYLKAAERLGRRPENCLALEDSFNGVRSAAAAGMMTIMVPDLIQPSDDIRRLCLRIAGDLHEVRELLEAMDQPAKSWLG